ncbi:endothelial differentiation-related factor 1 [Platysternon megacephalum]|uniref:Endothelial differentiation-related factor 1 n=1 Tax=Platysternon megacephalum TaxID=55544 RepID=A0A4D9E1V4_9SAUR|nr:endothelial differentiation-related factor 1 [Platysternon megacephalum]
MEWCHFALQTLVSQPSPEFPCLGSFKLKIPLDPSSLKKPPCLTHYELGAEGSKLAGPSPQNVLFTKERAKAGEDENPGGTFKSTNIAVARRLWVAVTPPVPSPPSQTVMVY